MKTKAVYVLVFLPLVVLFSLHNALSQSGYQQDVISTSKGDLTITSIGHGTLMFTFNKQVIHIDPVSVYADYAEMPDADIILITHHHYDHLDLNAIHNIRKDSTKIVMTQTCMENSEAIGNVIIMKNGETKTINELEIKAIPAYNIKHKRGNKPYHPKGVGNGYILQLGNKRVYVAGDTENTPEMKALKNIDIAFLPMNVPYTMTPEMVADAAKAFRSKILYPYHFGETNTDKLIELMKNETDIEIRIRALK